MHIETEADTIRHSRELRTRVRTTLERHRNVADSMDRRVASLSNTVVVIENATPSVARFSSGERIDPRSFAEAIMACRDKHKCEHDCLISVLAIKNGHTLDALVGCVEEVTETHIKIQSGDKPEPLENIHHLHAERHTARSCPVVSMPICMAQ